MLDIVLDAEDPGVNKTNQVVLGEHVLESVF